MRLVVGGRASGKTFKMVNWLKASPNHILVVHSEQEAHRIREDYYLNLGECNRIISVHSALNGKLRGSRRETVIAIDNLDLMLPFIMGASIGPVTLTNTEIEKIREYGEWK